MITADGDNISDNNSNNMVVLANLKKRSRARDIVVVKNNLIMRYHHVRLRIYVAYGPGSRKHCTHGYYVTDQCQETTIIGGVPITGAEKFLQQERLSGSLPQPAQS